jgi:hypothetical protein
VSAFQEVTLLALREDGARLPSTELTANELQAALWSADRSRAPGNRDALLRQFMAAGGKLSHDETVARNRAVTA